MSNNLTIKYITEYKKLETRLRKLAHVDDNAKLQVVLDNAEKINYFVKSNRSIIYSLSNLRNAVAHKDTDKYLAQINQLAYQEIKRIIDLLDKPPKVGHVFKRENMYWVDISEKIESVVSEMKNKNFTHVPVYDKGKYQGVFSETTLLYWLKDNMDNGRVQLIEKTIKDVNKEYLECNTSVVEIIPASYSIFEVQKKFNEAIQRRERLGALLITPNGSKNEYPIGIITAWDLPEIDKYV